MGFVNINVMFTIFATGEIRNGYSLLGADLHYSC